MPARVPKGSENLLRILITGGGTGGHVYPALATIEALKRMKDAQFLYVGAAGGIESRIVPREGIPLETIWVAGFARGEVSRNLLFPVKLLVSLWQSRRILRRFRPHVAVGMGGYVTGPVLYVAAKMGIPVLIQEQDAHPGVTSRLLARHADRICLAFEAARPHFAAVADRVRVTGNPIRTGIFNLSREEARKRWNLQEDRLTLLVFGGSQGSRAINQALVAVLPELLQQYPLQVIWQTGVGQFEAVQRQWPEVPDTVRLLPYIEDMGAAYAAADVIVCRAGASTLAELALAQRATILVPYPHAAGEHQKRNSRMVEEAGAAFMVEEGPEWERRLKKRLKELLADADLRCRQAEAWKALARPDAAERIAREILQLAGVKSANPVEQASPFHQGR